MALQYVTSHWYDKRARQWERMRDCLGGLDDLKARDLSGAVPKYLPFPIGWDSDRYAQYVARAAYFEGPKITLQAFLGLCFRKDPQSNLDEMMEQQIVEDVTLTGLSVRNAAKWLLYERIALGHAGVYVTYPDAPRGLTQAEAEQRNLRPTWRLYQAENIKQLLYQEINNVRVLVRVVLREYVERPSSKAPDEIDRYERKRILALVDGRVRQTLVTDSPEGQQSETSVPRRDGQALTKIPFFVVPEIRGTDGPLPPPLLGLADQSLDHYRVTTDHRYGLWWAGMFQPYGTGISEEEAPKHFGVRAWWFENPDAKVGKLDFQGTFEGHERTETAIEMRMARSGARVLAPDKGQEETATASNIRHLAETVTLSEMVDDVNSALLLALRETLLWTGADDEQMAELYYEISKDYLPKRLAPDEVRVLEELFLSGRLSEQTVYKKLQDGEIADDALSFEDEKELVQANPPPNLGAPPTLE